MKKAIIIFLFCLAGCWQSAPTPLPGECLECFDKRDCYYRNKDKDNVASICADDAKECRAARRFIFCEKRGEFGSKKFQECWDKRNSK